ncbi:unnamed protein product [Calypogeia fissa]
MVLLHVKQSEDHQFLYECQAGDYVDLVVRDIVTVHNLQLKIAHLKEEGDQLALHGPYKDPKRKVDDDSEEEDDKEAAQYSLSVKQRGPFYKRDPSYKRTGETCDPEVGNKLTQALEEAETCASKAQVLYKVPLTKGMLKEAITNVRGAVTICYPMGLPNYDPVHEELAGAYAGQDALDPDSATMWWAGKEFKRENKMSDHVGKNEKTKVIVKLTSPGRGAPAREPPVDAETQKAMMAWYYKKQEEQKKLQLDEDDNYNNSEWANPKALKSALHKLSGVKMR